MGQQQEKVEFESANSKKAQREPIFKTDQVTPSQQTCYKPSCHCSLKHIEVSNLKICSECHGNNSNMYNFRRAKNMPQFAQTNYKMQKVSKVPFSSLGAGEYHSPEYVHSQPTRITYFNSWSLPINRCLQEQKQGDETAVDQMDHSSKFSSPRKDIKNDISYEEPYVEPIQMITKLIKNTENKTDEIEWKREANKRQRRQNMNFSILQ